jgi:nucleoside-diphosphate-sugar epimerase
MDVTVLRAAGGAGRAITAELASRGHEVTTVTRGGTITASAGAHWPRPTCTTCPPPAGPQRADMVVLAASPPYHVSNGDFERMLAIPGWRRRDAS